MRDRMSYHLRRHNYLCLGLLLLNWSHPLHSQWLRGGLGRLRGCFLRRDGKLSIWDALKRAFPTLPVSIVKLASITSATFLLRFRWLNVAFLYLEGWCPRLWYLSEGLFGPVSCGATFQNVLRFPTFIAVIRASTGFYHCSNCWVPPIVQ